MGARENEVSAAVLRELGRQFPRDRLFRNHVGGGWQGPGFTMKPGQHYVAQGGERLIQFAQFVEFGLCPGSGDFVGWHDLLITPGMIGWHVAQLLSVETKSLYGKAKKHQENWRDQILGAGGVAMIVRDPAQLRLEFPSRWIEP
jgi:hypothetical protein